MSYRKRILESVTGALPQLLARFKYPISYGNFTINAEYMPSGTESQKGIFEIAFSEPPIQVTLNATIYDYIFPLLFQYRRQVFLKVLLIHEIHHFYQLDRIPDWLWMNTPPELPQIDVVNSLMIDALQDNVVFAFTPPPFLEAYRAYKDLEFILCYTQNPEQVFNDMVNERKVTISLDVPFFAPVGLIFLCSDLSEKFRGFLINGFFSGLNDTQKADLTGAVKTLIQLFAYTRVNKTYPADLSGILWPYLTSSYNLPLFQAKIRIQYDFQGLRELCDGYLQTMTI